MKEKETRRLFRKPVLGAAALAGAIIFGVLLLAPKAGQGHGAAWLREKPWEKAAIQAVVRLPERREAPPEPAEPSLEEKAQA